MTKGFTRKQTFKDRITQPDFTSHGCVYILSQFKKGGILK